ncbi:MAG: ACT domain-containing protein [Ornithinimicrobium sp.]
MTGLTDLKAMLATLEPTLREGEFVYACVSADDAARLPAEASITEAEGVTVVLDRRDADMAELTYDVVLRWISLGVHSSLEAVGLTAAISQTLGSAGISCNVLAGFYHDHLLVPVAQEDEAMRALRGLSRACQPDDAGAP